jgi:hypothetical protein
MPFVRLEPRVKYQYLVFEFNQNLNISIKFNGTAIEFHENPFICSQAFYKRIDGNMYRQKCKEKCDVLVLK